MYSDEVFDENDNNSVFHTLIGSEDKGRKSLATKARRVPPPGTSAVINEDGLVDNAKAWGSNNGVFWGAPRSKAKLPPGVYRMNIHQNLGPTFLAQVNATDSLVAFPDSASAEVVAEIAAFKTLRPAFTKHGFLYKRGILLWGPPGSGKTCTLQLALKMLVEDMGSIAVLIDQPVVAAVCLAALRQIEPDRPIVAILEDLDGLCVRYGESEYLALLDGESQIDNIVFLATTNYPERLDKRFVDRPSRIDTVKYIGMPSPEARAVYLRAKVEGITETEIEQYVSHSHDFSVAHLREFIILTRCFGLAIPAAAKRLSAGRRKVNSEQTPDGPKFGFVSPE